MKIDPNLIKKMYDTWNVPRIKLLDTLIAFGPNFLKTRQARQQWTAGVPTRNQCYVVSEWMYWYVMRSYRQTQPGPNNLQGVYVRRVRSPDDGMIVHWFLEYMHHNGISYFVDLTADQFDNYDKMDYYNSKRTMFMQTGCVGPSKRARQLALAMGYDEDYWKTGDFIEVPDGCRDNPSRIAIVQGGLYKWNALPAVVVPTANAAIKITSNTTIP